MSHCENPMCAICDPDRRAAEKSAKDAYEKLQEDKLNRRLAELRKLDAAKREK